MHRLHYYGLSTGGVWDRLPRLRVFMTKGEIGLLNPIAPATWPEATAMFDEALAVGSHPPYPVTKYPVTRLQWVQWEEGYDPEFPNRSGTYSRRSPQAGRPYIMGTMVKWCLTKAQHYCHICLTPLEAPYNASGEGQANDHLRNWDFDHCVPWMKSPSYKNNKYWLEQPRVARMSLEKKTGCFCHKPCHAAGSNKED